MPSKPKIKSDALNDGLISTTELSEELQPINEINLDLIQQAISEQNTVMNDQIYKDITHITKTYIESMDQETFDEIFKAPANRCPCSSFWPKPQTTTKDDIINKNAYLQLLKHLQKYYNAVEQCKDGHSDEDQGNLAEARQSIRDCLENQFTTTKYSDQLLAKHDNELRTLAPAITVVTTPPAVEAQPAAPAATL